MDRLLLSYNSVVFLTAFLLGLVLTALIAGLKNKESHTYLLATYFGVYTLITLAAFVVQSVDLGGSLLPAYIMVSLFLLLALVLLQFAYYFPSNRHAKESYVMLGYSIVSSLALIGIFLDYGTFDASGWFMQAGTLDWVIIVVLLMQVIGYSAILLIWVRKIILLQKDVNEPLWRKLLFPENRYAKAIRSFILVFSLSLVFTVSDYLQFQGVINQEEQYMIFVLVCILIFGLFFLAYISYLPERSGLLAKLVGSCLMLSLPPLILVGLRLDKMSRDAWHEERIRETRAYAEALVAGQNPETPPLLRYVLSLEETSAPSRESYQLHYAKDPTLSADTFFAFDDSFRNRRAFLSDKLGLEESAFQSAPLFKLRERVSDIHAMQLVDHFLHYDFMHEGKRYEMGYSYLDLRRALHGLNVKLALLQIVTFLVIILCFPLLLRRLLLRPLDALMDAVRSAKDGNLQVKARVYAADEIGFLARAFNTMMYTFVKAQAKIAEEEQARARLEAENARKDAELEQARRLQLAMLPQAVPRLPGLEIAVYLRAATEVGGDYYDFRQTTQGELIIGVGDATGHGLQAGTMVAATKSLFNAMVDRQEPVAFMEETSKALAAMGYENMYMALMIARIQEGRVNLTSAGMPYALIFRNETQALEDMRLPGLPLGSNIPFPYAQKEFHLRPGDVMLLQSDGLSERFNEHDEMMGDERVNAVFAEHGHKSAAEIVATLVELGEQWGGKRHQDDDITLMVVKRLAS